MTSINQSLDRCQIALLHIDVDRIKHIGSIDGADDLAIIDHWVDLRFRAQHLLSKLQHAVFRCNTEHLCTHAIFYPCD